MKVVVTGAGRGLGLEIVKEALRRGHEAAACFRPIDTDISVLEQLQREAQGRLILIELDVDEEQSVEKAKEAVKARWSMIDSLVNNAGILLAREQKIEQLEFAAVESSFRTNLFGPMKLVKHFLPLFSGSSLPCILNVCSEAGCFAGAYGGDYPYALSKAALNFFSAQLRKELSPKGFAVYAMHPGWMRTPMGGTQAPGDPVQTAHGVINLIERKLTIPDGALMIDYVGKPLSL